MIDGIVARMLHQTSELGSKLDTMADLLFFVFALIKVLSSVEIPLWLWIGLIALVKIINVISGFVCRRCFIAMHTRMNKIVGILLFIVLLFAGNTPWQFNLVLVCITCAVATFAAIQEGHPIRMGKETL